MEFEEATDARTVRRVAGCGGGIAGRTDGRMDG